MDFCLRREEIQCNCPCFFPLFPTRSVPALSVIVLGSYRVGAIDARPSVGKLNEEDNLPLVVQTGAEGIDVEAGDGRAVESVSLGDDAVVLRAGAGEDTHEAGLRRSQKGDLPSRIERRLIQNR